MQVILIDNYDSFTWNLAHQLWALGVELEVIENDKVSCDQIIQRAPAALVLSPGPGRPSRSEDFGVCASLLRDPRFTSTPTLGVCLGHQGLAARFGAKVHRAPRVMHGKVSAIYHHGQGLFAGLPSPAPMMRYHSLLVERESLPSSLEIDAWTEEGLIMALSHRDRPWFGVQFHPESVSSVGGDQLMANFIAYARDIADGPR